MADAINIPGEELSKLKIKNPNYPKDNWKKQQYTHVTPDKKEINIHYWENIQTGEQHGFKFKND